MPYRAGLDVHEYLDSALLEMASNGQYDMVAEGGVFSRTFQYLNDALGDKAFKRWNGNAFAGKFLMSVFEVLATGVSFNVQTLGDMQPDDRKQFLVQRAKGLWSNEAFTTNSGAGVRGTTRLAKLLPIAKDLLNPNPQ
jgi:hypothetical protein